MRLGAGPGRTRDDHVEIAAQLYALVARAREIADLADIVGEAGLTLGDRRYLAVASAFLSEFLSQRRQEVRTLDETLARAWRVASLLPRRELTMLGADLVRAHYVEESGDSPAAG
jgi:V/A-type H+-transporting ATPase subunit B